MTIKHDGHEHEFEPQYGLPEPLPGTERILWQGSPDWRMLARKAFHVRTLGVYFGVIVALRVATMVGSGGTAPEVLKAVAMMVPLALLAIGISATMAWLSSRTTVYTVTDKRVVMRVGIVLSLTFNLPLKRLAQAGIRLHGKGCGDIPLTLAGTDTIAYLHLWPHARPWRVARPEPMLRCVPDVAHVSAVLAQAWGQATGVAVAQPVLAAPAPVLVVDVAGGSSRAPAQHPEHASRLPAGY